MATFLAHIENQMFLYEGERQMLIEAANAPEAVRKAQEVDPYASVTVKPHPQVTIHISADQDDLPVRGHAIASGDPKYDRKVEDGIIERLDRGDIWAWASVELWAETEIGGTTICSESEYLGACSYRDEDDFRQGSGYFDGMAKRAKEDLQVKIAALRSELLEAA